MKKILISLLFLGISLWNLTGLPIFSDEAIYIHWAQSAVRDPQSYLFLSMLDGKPPLHVWALMPIVATFRTDPLWFARAFSVICSLLTACVAVRTLRVFSLKARHESIAFAVFLFLPAFFFHARMALAESLFLLAFAFSLWGLLDYVIRKRMISILFFILGFSASLWIKTTAFFFIPIYAVFAFFLHQEMSGSYVGRMRSFVRWLLSKRGVIFILAGVLSGGIFAILKISPVFPSLFSRSADYSFTISELLQGEWKYVLFTSSPRVVYWLGKYMTLLGFVVAFAKHRARTVFLLSAFAFIFPIILIGKVLTFRYFLPAVYLLSCSAVLAACEYERYWKKLRGIWVLFVLHVIVFSSIFVFFPSQTPLTKEDKNQYLFQWSSGYGIPEVREFFIQQSKENTNILVATEGYFGTLPDGLKVYFTDRFYSGKLEIIGVGQPIAEVPLHLRVSARSRPVYLIVNQSRFSDTNVDHYEVLSLFPRPNNQHGLYLLKIRPEKE